MTTSYRNATEADIPSIVALLADDLFGAARETATLPLPEPYLEAFQAIQQTPYQRLIVAVSLDRVVGTLQLLLVPGLSSGGAWHGQIQAMRIASDLRGRGMGAKLVAWAVNECTLAGCTSVTLVSDNARLDAHRFWTAQGFTQSHAGFKRFCSPRPELDYTVP